MDDATLVRFRYTYDGETGEWLWREPSERAVRKGALPGLPAGTIDHRDGCRYLMLNKRLHRASRLAWLYTYGEWPASQVLYNDPDLPVPERDRLKNLKLSIDISDLTQEKLKSLVRYEMHTGAFYWLVARKGIKKNEQAGTVKSIGGAAIGSKRGYGYRYLRIDGVDYVAQRLAWLYVYGRWPETRLIFKDGDQLNCRIENLAEGEFAHGTRQDEPLTFEERKQRHATTYRKHDLKRRFSTAEVPFDHRIYEAMHNAQNGLCAICHKPETQERNGRVKWLGVDHNHKTGQVRDLLCHDCNNGIERFHESIELLEATIAYLRRHASKEDAA